MLVLPTSAITALDPATLAGAKLVLEASSLSATADDAAISTWADRSAYANNATGSGGTRPTKKTEASGAHSVLFTAASSQKLTTALTMPGSTNAYVIVAAIKPVASANNGIVGWGAPASETAMAFRTNGLGLNNYWYGDDYASNDREFLAGDWQIVTATFDGYRRRLRVNGYDLGVNTPGGTKNTTSTVAVVGDTGQGFGEYMNGRIAALYVIDGTLTGAQIAGLEKRAADQCKAQSFVYREATNLMLNGRPWRFVGVNAYNIAYPHTGASAYYNYNATDLDTLFATIATTCPGGVIRFFAWQEHIYPTSVTPDWTRMDLIVALARKYGLKLFPALGRTDGRTAAWFQTGISSTFISASPAYTDYISHTAFLTAICDRYKAAPEIFAWHPLSEAASAAGDGTNIGYFNSAMWLMMTTIKAADSNHLTVQDLLADQGQFGTQPANVETLVNDGNTDAGSAHDYSVERYLYYAAQPITSYTASDKRYLPPRGDTAASYGATLSRIAKGCGKPFLTGEYGITVISTTPGLNDMYSSPIATSGTDGGIAWAEDYTLAQRAALIDAKLDAHYANGGSGMLVWNWSGARDATEMISQFDVWPADPSAAVLTAWALIVANGQY